MRFEYRRDGRVHSVELEELGDRRWRARWVLRDDGSEAPERRELLLERELEVEAVPTGEASWSMRAGTAITELRVEREGLRRTVVSGGRAVGFDYCDPHSVGGGAAAGHGGGPAEIASPMPGRVVELPVAEGERVEEGRTVVVVEAMKMANEYRSPIAGTVSAVRCAVGEAVEGGAVLLVVEPDAD
jgi:biotin carboxyl carrier protein